MQLRFSELYDCISAGGGGCNSLNPASNDQTTGWEISNFLAPYAQVKPVGQMSSFLVSGCSVDAHITGVVGVEEDASALAVQNVRGKKQRGVKRVI